MPIKHIDLSYAPVLDYSPLAQLPLEVCRIQHARITDLGVLRGKPLRELCLWGCEDARNYAVLKDIQTLENLQIPDIYRKLPPEDYAAIGALRDHPNLRQIGASIMNGQDYRSTGSKEVFWQDWDREEAFFSALRAQGLTFTFRKLPGGAYVLDFFDQPLRDLSILKGMPIEELDLHRCPFVDLTPLRDLKLKKLSISSDSVTDFSPLAGMPIERLYLRHCSHLKDLAPLKELPLRELYLDECKSLTDVAVLAEIPTLEKLTVPLHAQNVDALRKLPNLKQLGYGMIGGNPNYTVEEFWKHYDLVRRMTDAGFKPSILKRLDNGRLDVDLSGNEFADLGPLAGMPVEVLALWKTNVRDLSPLRGMALKSLQISHTAVADLEPLRGMPLRNLRLFRTDASDLGPLEGMPLNRLDIGYTKVSDISVLRGMPLTEAKFSQCTALTDISPLAGSRELVSVTLPPNAKDFEFLRGFPKLERLSFTEDPSNHYRPDKTAVEFWKEFDAKKK
jgi:Leucine-rich repeat (LRR) protein